MGGNHGRGWGLEAGHGDVLRSKGQNCPQGRSRSTSLQEQGKHPGARTAIGWKPTFGNALQISVWSVQPLLANATPGQVPRGHPVLTLLGDPLQIYQVHHKLWLGKTAACGTPGGGGAFVPN